MAKRRQHFVPQFYLRAFRSALERIHLYHLRSRTPIEHASLRKQCYRHRFYGPSDEVEDRLSELEDAAAPVVRAICDSGEPPRLRSEQHQILLAFVGLQVLRTPVIRNNLRALMAKMDDQIFGENDPDSDSDLARFAPLTEREVLELQLGNVQEFVGALSDLELHVARAGRKEELITSDNPAFRYNSYCRGVRDYGVLGADSRGLQIFLPLSPRVLLLLYDGAIYDLDDRSEVSGKTSSICRGDVERLNAVQIINAERCIYFSDWSKVETVGQTVSDYLPYKQGDLMRVHQRPVVGNSAIVHSWEGQPELRFTLPLSRLRWRARKVRPEERATFTRRGLTWKYAL